MNIMKKWILPIILLTIIVVSGCVGQSQERVTYNNPSACTDANHNNICDKDETPTQSNTPAELQKLVITSATCTRTLNPDPVPYGQEAVGTSSPRFVISATIYNPNSEEVTAKYYYEVKFSNYGYPPQERTDYTGQDTRFTIGAGEYQKLIDYAYIDFVYSGSDVTPSHALIHYESGHGDYYVTNSYSIVC